MNCRSSEPMRVDQADDSKLASLFAQPSFALGSKGISGPALAARLAPPIDDPNVVHALALRKASHGDIEGALADLEKRLERAGEDANAASFRTEIARLNAWKVARDTWLAEQVAAGAKIQLERDGKKLFFKAAKLENGVLRLEAAKYKEEVPVISLEPALLAAQMKTTPAQSPEWVRSYAMLLCADERWAKLLKDNSEQSQALRLDADKRYAELSKLGLAAEHLAILAQSVSPADAPAANSVLARLHRIRLEVATQPLILQRIESLLQLARIAAEKVYDESRPAPEFGGKSNWLDGSTLELTYEFTSPAELDDWVERPDDMKAWRASWDPIVVPQSQQSFRMGDGVWAGQGSFVFRHVLPFEAPMNMRVSVRHGKAADETTDSGHFTMGICDDGAGNFAAFSESGEIYVDDSKTGKQIYTLPASIPNRDLGVEVLLEVAHDGSKVRFVHDGVVEPEQPVGSRRSGGVFLIIHCNREFIIGTLNIRGKVGAEGMKVLRERWISGALRKTGLQ